LLGDAEFKADFYDRRHMFDAALRERVGREAKARKIRNVRKRSK